MKKDLTIRKNKKIEAKIKNRKRKVINLNQEIHGLNNVLLTLKKEVK